MKLVFATHNSGKVKEMQAILAGLDLEILTANQAGVTEDILEDGLTFAENALIKARYVSKKTGQWAVADDSGICIDALHGKPGINTARWAGASASGEQIVAHTLEQLQTVPEGKRSASFVSCAALVAPDGREWTFQGEIRGTLPLNPMGQPIPKLPYDTIFIPEGHHQTFSQMPDQEKNSLSHRGRAFAQLRQFLLNNTL